MLPRSVAEACHSGRSAVARAAQRHSCRVEGETDHAAKRRTNPDRRPGQGHSCPRSQQLIVVRPKVASAEEDASERGDAVHDLVGVIRGDQEGWHHPRRRRARTRPRWTGRRQGQPLETTAAIGPLRAERELPMPERRRCANHWSPGRRRCDRVTPRRIPAHRETSVHGEPGQARDQEVSLLRGTSWGASADQSPSVAARQGARSCR